MNIKQDLKQKCGGKRSGKNNPCGCHKWQTSISHRSNGRKCPYCYSNKSCIHNNITVSHPQIIQEWNYEENMHRPEKFTQGSQEKIWWKCNKGHEWKATINNRIRNKTGCPHCSVSRGYSKAQITWLESIMEEHNIKIRYALS